MIIITYSETDSTTIEQRLGKAEYSYYFILKKYLPILERLGTVIAVRDPAIEVDQIYRSNPDEDCLFLSFSPPHRTLLGLQCPSVCIVAWEFSTIPQEEWHDEPRNNWQKTFTSIGNILTISNYAADVIIKACPEIKNLVVIPAPIKTVTSAKTKRTKAANTIAVNGTIYDSNNYNLSPDMVNDTVNHPDTKSKRAKWDQTHTELMFTEDDEDSNGLLVGFYSAETWGAWSRTQSPSIMLPYQIEGPIEIFLTLVGYGNNIGSKIEVAIDSIKHEIELTELPIVYSLHFSEVKAADAIKFSGLDLTPAPGARDHRSLGMGLKGLAFRRPEGYVPPPPSVPQRVQIKVDSILRVVRNRLGLKKKPTTNRVELNGIVYTSVFNPQDGRKNWEDIVTAFCWAFKDRDDATLVLKMTHNNASTFLGKLLLLFAQLSPFKCRVVAIHGFLSDTQYQKLLNVTDYVVNSSHCEGQCLPLMEYMGQGKPAITPDHTAMQDYVTSANSFVVKSSLYPTFWPFDARRAYRTLCYRIDWDSLHQAFVQSHEVARSDPHRYNAMSKASIESISTVSSDKVVEEKLRGFIDGTAKKYN
jgi:glycosyltransferase involved in cell wall biosynthesis